MKNRGIYTKISVVRRNLRIERCTVRMSKRFRVYADIKFGKKKIWADWEYSNRKLFKCYKSVIRLKKLYEKDKIL